MRSAARRSHGAAGWRLSKKTPATAKAAPVCPDGKEPSVKQERRGSVSGERSQGRVRSIQGFKKKFTVNAGDVESGTIYVLRSLSKDPEIASLKNLYKIGFTTTPLEVRTANAKNEPTYLCAGVETVATWRVYNVKSSTFESLIHKLFGSVQLQVTVDGKRPKEWYVVPFPIIEQAVMYIINGQPVAYDKDIRQIIVLNE